MKKAFTLVEMLVALAVSAVIISATYASFEMIQKQYKKNIDVAQLHTSGRAVMQILEREIRMAGYEFRDDKGLMTYGKIVGPLVLTDSGNKCCDEVTIIYDEVTDTVNGQGVVTSSIVDRIKTRFWTEAHSSSKRGSRFRLYKRRTILGTNNAILATPRVGGKEVMADYIEDLQLTNISTTGTLYSSGTRQNTIEIWNPTKPRNQKKVGSISTPIGFEALAFGPDGLLYSSGTRQNTIEIWNPTKPRNQKKIGSISTPIGFEALAFGPDGLLYSSGTRQNTIEIWDITKGHNQKKVGSISTPIGFEALAFGPDGLLYSSGTRQNTIEIWNPTKTQNQKKVGSISTPIGFEALAFGPDGLLYSSGTRQNTIEIWNPTKSRNQKKVGSISTPIGFEALVFDIKTTGQLEVININLTLRTKNEYGKNKSFLKKIYHSGNFNFNKNDKYKRDTFSTTVSVRNL